MKTHIIILLLLTTHILSCTGNVSVKKDTEISCETLNACIKEIHNTESSKYGLSRQASSLGKKFPAFGEQALIELLELLQSTDPHVNKVAGYAVAQFEHIDQVHFPKIRAAIERDTPWLPRALGVIQSDEAAKYSLDIFLASSSSPSNQEAFAVKRQGQRVLPFILERAKCGEQCNRHSLSLLTHIIGEMDNEVKELAARNIIEELNAPLTSFQDKENLIGLFYQMGDSGKFVEHPLYRLHKENPDLQAAIDFAFIGIRSEYSGKVFASYLKISPNMFALSEIADVGPAAKDAGPILVELLSHPHRDIRLGSARALGYIQYANAVPFLIPLMTERSDVRLNWLATNSLAMLGQPEAILPLEEVSKSHWYPGIRVAATKAIEKIRAGNARNNHTEDESDFLGYKHFDVESCEEVSLKPAPDERIVKLSRSSTNEEKKHLTYNTYVLSYGPSDEEAQRENDPDGIITVNQDNIVEHREAIEQIPDVALKIEDGWLAGSDRGEWGGELVFIPDDGRTVKLLDANVEDIYKFGDTYIVISGLAHLMLNDGEIFQLERKGNEWYVETWINLPAAPSSSWLVETGELLVNTYSSGSILVSKNGELRMAPCKKN